MPVSTIEWRGGLEDGCARIVAQTLLPTKFEYVDLATVEQMYDAIVRLEVRGAPAIGIAGAMGVVLGVREVRAENFADFEAEFERVVDYLAGSRPTAVNLFWALQRMKEIVTANVANPVPAIKQALLGEALRIHEEDRQMCRAIGENGARYVPDDCTILTHCNAGGLATADYGTALAVMFHAHEHGKKIRVYADETRPLLQGARLTTWELMQADIDVTLICDNMSGHAMKDGRIDLVIVGADRIAANGDTANKIGTYMVAVLAHEHGIPFYVAAPASTFDLTIENGDAIPIEERGSEEIVEGLGRRIAPEGVKTFSPAFDVTPAKYITAIITERGVIEKPDTENIKKTMG